MKKQQTILFVFAYVALAMAAMVVVRADQPTPPASAIPDGSPSKISDWALAGVIWSDASLTKKLASEAAKRSESAEQTARMREIAKKSGQIVEALEAFGWKQVKRTDSTVANRADGTAANQKGSSNPNADAASADSGEREKSSADNRKKSSTPPGAEPRDSQPPTLDRSIKRFDTETPADRDDPGIDDERTGRDLRLDLAQYRVDDYIDETPSEANNRADAIEDGVEGAIAAAAGRRGMGGRVAGRISEREVMTRSATLPYSEDSIYDSDDYDPDVDYIVNNPQGTDFDNPASADLGDRDDDIDRSDPAKVIGGEDELIAAMARERQAKSSDAAAASQRSNRTDMARYTTERGGNRQDANWVQFHLDANQALWSQFTTPDNLFQRTHDSVTRLRADARAAIEATDNPQLSKILRAIAQ